MTEPLFTHEGDGRWRFEGELGFSSVPAVLKDSANCFAGTRDIDIDLQGVTRADSAGLALLLEWMREAQRGGGRVTFSNVPQQLQAIAGLCGLEAIFSFNGQR